MYKLIYLVVELVKQKRVKCLATSVWTSFVSMAQSSFFFAPPLYHRCSKPSLLAVANHTQVTTHQDDSQSRSTNNSLPDGLSDRRHHNVPAGAKVEGKPGRINGRGNLLLPTGLLGCFSVYCRHPFATAFFSETSMSPSHRLCPRPRSGNSLVPSWCFFLDEGSSLWDN